MFLPAREVPLAWIDNPLPISCNAFNARPRVATNLIRYAVAPSGKLPTGSANGSCHECTVRMCALRTPVASQDTLRGGLAQPSHSRDQY